MLITSIFSWWYGQGWLHIIHASTSRLVKVAHFFSVPILLRTLWAPWRRTISYAGAGLDARLHAFIDNLVSRFIGFTVRIVVLIAAGCVLIVTAFLGLISIFLWPLLPLAVPVLVLVGLQS